MGTERGVLDVGHQRIEMEAGVGFALRPDHGKLTAAVVLEDGAAEHALDAGLPAGAQSDEAHAFALPHGPGWR